MLSHHIHADMSTNNGLSLALAHTRNRELIKSTILIALTFRLSTNGYHKRKSFAIVSLSFFPFYCALYLHLANVGIVIVTLAAIKIETMLAFFLIQAKW